MTIERFEDIIAWQKAKELTLLIYKSFQSVKDFAFRDQIQRAAISVMNNIAEGFERKGAKEYSRFLYIAKGSAGELRSMLYVAKELKYIDDEIFIRYYQYAEEISKMLAGLIRAVESKKDERGLV
jgi:four helix bundle protein